jgi:hypothetical protein
MSGIDVEKIGVKITSENLVEPLFISWRDVMEFQPEIVVAKFGKLQQSATIPNLLGEPFKIEISCAGNWVTEIEGGCNQGPGGVLETCGLMTNSSDDRLCLFRSAIMGLMQHTIGSNNQAREAKKLASGNNWAFVKYLKPLLKYCQVRNFNTRFPLHQYAPLIEAYCNEKFPELSPFRLIVVASQNIADEWLYPQKDTKYTELPKTNLVLYFDDAHFTTVWYARKFFSVKNICYGCRKGIHELADHSVRCSNKCKFCGKHQNVVPCPSDGSAQQCPRCKNIFKNADCFANHFGRTCRLFHMCIFCGTRYNTRHKHICGEWFCSTCKIPHGPRACFMTPIVEPEESPVYKLAIFDFESRQEDKIGNAYAHRVNFAACQVLCQLCMDNGNWENGCENCGAEFRYWSEPEGHLKNFNFQKRIKFIGCHDPIKSFIEYLISITPPKGKTIAVSHFGGRYDIALLMRAIYDHSCKFLQIFCKHIIMFSNSKNRNYGKWKQSLFVENQWRWKIRSNTVH